ncbi:hypothetical protein Tco_0672215 [Tanacetum coccineum]
MIKKKQHSHVLSEHTLIGECLSGYAMPQLHSKDACWIEKGTENVVADHLSQIEKDESSNDSEVDDNFPGETLMEINTKDEHWFVDFAKLLGSTDDYTKGIRYQQKEQILLLTLNIYFWEEPLSLQSVF